jgi:hypothetical protein
MALVSRKTRKAIRKGVKKAINRHGPEIAAGIAGGIASTLATLASTVSPDSRKGRSNLGELAHDVTERISGTSDKKERKSHAGSGVADHSEHGRGRENPRHQLDGREEADPEE